MDTKRLRPDRSKINMHRRYEVRHWTKALRVDRTKLQKTVDKVGNSAAAVRKELKACGMLAISGARPARFSIANCFEQLRGSEGLL